MASKTPSGEAPSFEIEVAEEAPLMAGWTAARRVLAPLASLKLTVVLFMLAILLVLFGTLAQVDRDIWEVIDKIKGVASEEFEKMFPAKQPSKVVVKTTDGQEFSEYLEYPKGDPREPMTMEDLENKFNSLSAALLSSARQTQTKEMIFTCENMSVGDFMTALKV